MKAERTMHCVDLSEMLWGIHEMIEGDHYVRHGKWQNFLWCWFTQEGSHDSEVSIHVESVCNQEFRVFVVCGVDDEEIIQLTATLRKAVAAVWHDSKVVVCHESVEATPTEEPSE